MVLIKFSLYEKKTFEERGELVPAGPTITGICGSTDSTNSWGELFKITGEKTEIPVFQKELEGKSYPFGSFFYVEIEEFRAAVISAVDDDLAECREEEKYIKRQIEETREGISELRELVETCSEDERKSYVFDFWNRNIAEKEEDLRNLQENLQNFEKDDWVFTRAIEVEKLLADMEKYLHEDRYYVIPEFTIG